MEKVRYMISDAATMAGVESHVLRYWEDELELTIPRNEMGHRYYTRENIQEFQKIKELKEQGYQLKAIRMILHNGGVIPPDIKIEGMGSVSGAALSTQNHAKTAPAISIVPPSPSAQQTSATVQTVAISPSSAARQAATAPQAAASAAPQSSAALPTTTTPQAAPQPLATIQPMAIPQPSTAIQTMTTPQAVAVQPAATPLSAEERMAQFRELMSDIVGHAIAQNNEELSINISQEVKETVLKEMNYLFREQEEAQEDRYKKLDAAIRGNLKKKKSLFAPKDKPAKKEKVRAGKNQAADKKISISGAVE